MPGLQSESALSSTERRCAKVSCGSPQSMNHMWAFPLARVFEGLSALSLSGGSVHWPVDLGLLSSGGSSGKHKRDSYKPDRKSLKGLNPRRQTKSKGGRRCDPFKITRAKLP